VLKRSQLSRERRRTAPEQFFEQPAGGLPLNRGLEGAELVTGVLERAAGRP
jgi:hypothetical protein